ncbi:MAG: class I SAM-dependent methyltransferase [Candidatus Methanoperedens sp.]|nr:class I SAM-dependent methyltransferase [Candidatus Methanoperedens sp.]
MHCPECDLIFVPESYHLSLLDEEARYNLHNNTILNEGYVNNFNEIISLVRKYCPDLNSILDYGCGPGPVLSELLKINGFNCDIYDPIFFPDRPDRTYDLVISTEVFEHFRNVKTELKKVLSLISPGGYLVVMTLLHDPVTNFEDWWYHSDPTHISFFSRKTFEWICGKYDLKFMFSNMKNIIIIQNLYK